MTTLDDVSPKSRIAEPGEGISLDELRLAARNHGMPLEALDLDVTPPGLHYLLTHYDIPLLDAAGWRLTVDGHVDNPLDLDLATLTSEPAATQRVTFECAGNGRAKLDPRPVSQPWLDEAVGTAAWTGVPLAAVLRRAGVRPGAVDVVFTGADHGVERGVEQDYQRALAVENATADGVMLVHTMNGAPLPPQHGAPLRLVVPGWYGMTQVKWLTRITVLDEPFTGYQNATAYRVTHDPGDPGEPVRRIQPKALLRPPGFPDFQSRTRIVEAGSHELTGRAWSGEAPVTRVEVSVDAGVTWHEASLDPAGDPYEWRRWRWRWVTEATGLTEIWVRAADETGNVQPVDQRWNRQAMANNHVQRTRVLVR